MNLENKKFREHEGILPKALRKITDEY